MTIQLYPYRGSQHFLWLSINFYKHSYLLPCFKKYKVSTFSNTTMKGIILDLSIEWLFVNVEVTIRFAVRNKKQII
jgi:hypothetical protein